MKQLLGTLGARWKALTPGRRMAAGLIGALVLVGAYVAYAQTSKTDWGVLYANLDDETASGVMQQLDADGVTYKLDGNGSRILVPQAALAATRLRLAGEGVTGQPVPPGFEEVFAGQGLATSDFEQRVNYERALEGEQRLGDAGGDRRRGAVPLLRRSAPGQRHPAAGDRGLTVPRPVSRRSPRARGRAGSRSRA